MKPRITAIFLLFLLVFALPTALSETQLPGYAQQVFLQTNQERAKYGLPALVADPALTAAAQLRATEIVKKFSHTRPNGQTGSSASSLARNENIARGRRTPDKVMAAWLTSPTHRRSILSSVYGTIGVACVRSGNIYYWVQLFGK